MRKPRNDRKARFLAALRLTNTTMAEWASGHGVTQGYVSNLLAGRRQHETINKRIDAFTAKHLPNVGQ